MADYHEGWQPDLHFLCRVGPHYSWDLRELVNLCLRYNQDERSSFPKLLKLVQARRHLHDQQLRDAPVDSPLWTSANLLRTQALDHFALYRSTATYEAFEHFDYVVVPPRPAAALYRDNDEAKLGREPPELILVRTLW